MTAKPKSTYPLARTFTHRLHTLGKLTDRATQAAYQHELGIPLGEGRCLMAMGAVRALSVNDLALLANLDKGQASRAAQSLVEQGLARKEASELDGRGVVLTLTQRGERLWHQAAELVERRNNEILACLTPQECAALDGILDKLVAHARTGTAAEE